ncbi:MAG: hypothetical protein BZY81_08580 [SAR202 cluster bacterium Io17-Chloro-G4]|nr:MAG: hypothetical protein BZY81_08580 [SAR202 cluster bacterium Io17-Chloro-G4]
MPNRDTQAAWHYHNGTKHPDGFLMDPWHSYDPMDNPLLFKIYSELDPIPLSPDSSPTGMPALEAISSSVEPSAKAQVPNFMTLSKILHYSAGVTKRIDYPWGEMAFRAAACTGALFHIELYLVCGELPGLKAGVYHFDAHYPALKQLRKGDYRGVLVKASGNHSAVAGADAVICYTDVFWRNACKYQAREYRHSYWDSGTILANTLAVSSANQISSQVVMGFVDSTVDNLLGLDVDKEVSLAMVPLGCGSELAAVPGPEIKPISLETLPISDHETDFPPVREMHEASSLSDGDEVTAWRNSAQTRETQIPSGRLIPLDPFPVDEMPQDGLETVISRRGSSRQFSHDSISFRQLSTVLQTSTEGIPADFLGSNGGTLNDVYIIANAVEGLASGTYVLSRESQALELLDEGDFRHEAGYLGLRQALPADASVNIYFMVELNRTLETLGNRGYRAAQMEASIMAGKIYLASYAQRLGATGLTFYEDSVTQFFSPHAKDKSVMFLMAVGKRARQ